MGEFPVGSVIIPNPVNRIPGFTVREHHFVPGFPQMAWPMVEWVLDTRYRARFDAQRWKEASILVYEAGESQLIAAMQAVEAAFKGIKAFSLPSMGDDGSRIHVELGVRGEPGEVEPAMDELRALVGAAGLPLQIKRPAVAGLFSRLLDCLGGFCGAGPFTVSVAALTLASAISVACLATLVRLSYAELLAASIDLIAATATSEPAGAFFDTLSSRLTKFSFHSAMRRSATLLSSVLASVATSYTLFE